MRTEFAMTLLMTVCLCLVGCSRADHESTEVSNRNGGSKLILSGTPPTNGMRVAASTLTNSPGDIYESAGAPVHESQSASDRFRAALASDSVLSADSEEIQASTRGNNVVLSGTVQTEVERQLVVDKARQMFGAEKVQDNLVVSPAPPGSVPVSTQPIK